MAAKSSAAKGDAAPSAGEFLCPDCGRTFTRAAALGAHRRMAHGVAGTSRVASATGAGRRRRSAAAAPSAGRARATGTGRVAETASRGRAAVASGVDRNGLLRSLFPSGIPAREDAIRAVNAWLDEAERLARLR